MIVFLTIKRLIARIIHETAKNIINLGVGFTLTYKLFVSILNKKHTLDSKRKKFDIALKKPRYF
ncbi:hypothetical protein THMIRHAM_13700 [Thiomicrorhabdus immobilis]|uniref:Uncharacterized protein n=1 Tax=Thiomicrorhabdus immobilis TaxID=2791037 RepID=A0ABM7MDW3_9GAMM|nr:hypothetical protein THMIRHAM_13700 [Thiomicrorhabdus immobilis]